MTISPARFERHLIWLRRRGYRPINPSQWRAWIEEGCELPSKPVLVTFDNSYAWLEEHALPILLRNGFGALIFTLGDGAEEQGTAGADLMTAEQLSRWAAAGMALGVRFPVYVSRLSAAEMGEEIIRRKDQLENTLGSRVKSFAYPGGLYNEALRSSAEGLFEFGFTCEPGRNALHTDLLRMSTTAITPDAGLAAFALRMMVGRRPTQLLAPRQNRAASAVAGQSCVLAGEFAQAATRGAAVKPES